MFLSIHVLAAPANDPAVLSSGVTETALTTAQLEAPACNGEIDSCLKNLFHKRGSAICPKGGPETCPNLSFDGLKDKLQSTPTAPPGDCDGACQEKQCETSEALALCLKPTKSKEYYKAQAEAYFDFLDNEKCVAFESLSAACHVSPYTDRACS